MKIDCSFALEIVYALPSEIHFLLPVSGWRMEFMAEFYVP
jgi:hypothetical protein